MTMNRATLIGRVGKDPEVRHMPSGDAVANLSLATTEKWKDKESGERMETTEWHRLNFFGRLAEIVGEYVRTGDLICVEGGIHTRKWVDKDGIDRYSTEIKVREMKMLAQKRDDGQAAAPAAAPSRPAGRAPAPAAAEPRRPTARPAPKPSSGFDDMDDDMIPF